MARTALTPTLITRAGIALPTPASSDNTNGNSCPNSSTTFLYVSNTDSASRTIIVAPTRTVDGQSVAGVTHTLAASAIQLIGPFPQADYGSQLQINTSAALLKIAVLELA